MTPPLSFLELVTAERIAELYLARRNTAALLAKGAFEFAPRALSSNRADARPLVSEPVDFRRDAYDQSNLACSLSVAPGSARLDSDDAWPSLDHAHHRPSGRSAGDRTAPTALSRTQTTSSSLERLPSCPFALACPGLL